MEKEKNEFGLDVVSVRLAKDRKLLSEMPVTSAKDAVDLIGNYLYEMDREMLCVLNLNTKGIPINCTFASIGSVDSSIAHPREIFKASILSNASNMILLHNHPSGNLNPSKDDVLLTDKMVKLCNLMGIPLLDHIIVGGDNSRYFSFNDKNIMPKDSFTLETNYNKIDFTASYIYERGTEYMDKERMIKKIDERIEFCKEVGKKYTGFPRYALKASWDIKADENNVAKEILESNSNPLQGLEQRLEYCKSREEWCRQSHRNEWINGWISRQNEISNVIEQVKGNEEKQRLFVDMDGTLTVFTPQASMDALYVQGYFKNLPPHENVIEAIRYIIENHPEIEVNVLSAVLLDSRYALDEKNAWLDKYLPEIDAAHRIFVPNGSDKKEFIWEFKDSDYLMDDYTKNLMNWMPARGIKLLNAINHSNGTWQYDRIRYDREPVDLANAITNIMTGKEHIYDKSEKEKEEKVMVKFQSAVISNYEGYVVLTQFDRNEPKSDKQPVYLGKRENYDNHGNYDNSDNSLVHISDNRKMFSFLEGSGWVLSQQEMIDNGTFTEEDYAEFAKLKETVLKQFKEVKELRFEIDINKTERGEGTGVPFKYPNWNEKEVPIIGNIQKEIKIPSITVDPAVLFFEDERPVEFNKFNEQSDANKEVWRSIIENKRFAGAQFTAVGEHGQTLILTKSIRDGVDFQLSFFDKDGEPAMHEDYYIDLSKDPVDIVDNMKMSLYSRLAHYSYDGKEIVVTAQYEGKEIQMDKREQEFLKKLARYDYINGKSDIFKVYEPLSVATNPSAKEVYEAEIEEIDRLVEQNRDVRMVVLSSEDVGERYVPHDITYNEVLSKEDVIAYLENRDAFLEEIYARLGNRDVQPSNFYGHSPSVGDAVVVMSHDAIYDDLPFLSEGVDYYSFDNFYVSSVGYEQEINTDSVMTKQQQRAAVLGMTVREELDLLESLDEYAKDFGNEDLRDTVVGETMGRLDFLHDEYTFRFNLAEARGVMEREADKLPIIYEWEQISNNQPYIVHKNANGTYSIDSSVIRSVLPDARLLNGKYVYDDSRIIAGDKLTAIIDYKYGLAIKEREIENEKNAKEQKEKEEQQKEFIGATISFYVAECMEFPSLGEYHEGLTLQEAFDILEQIPSERMNAVKGIGFTLNDGSEYDGDFDLLHGTELQDEIINIVDHYRESPLVQQAIKDCRAELEKRYGKEQSLSKIQEIIKNHDEDFRYQLLSRMKSDCDYYLGYGNRNPENLWSNTEAEHISDMKELYNSFPEDKKPEWLTIADIEKYEKEMLGEMESELYRLAVQAYSAEQGVDIENEYVKEHSEELVYCYQNHMELIDFDAWTHCEDIIGEKITFDEYAAINGRVDYNIMEVESIEQERTEDDIKSVNEICAIFEELRNGDNHHGEDGVLHANSENIHVEGHTGTWHVIEVQRSYIRKVMDDEFSADYYLLEHDTYGDEAAMLIVNKNGEVVIDDVYNGFDDLMDRMEEFGETLTTIKEAGYDIEKITDTLGCEIKDLSGNIHSYKNCDEVIEAERSLVEDMYNRVIQAMEVAGYSLNIVESTSKNPIYNYEMQTVPLQFESLKDNIEWLEGVVFDDPEISDKVEKIMHPERFTDEMNVVIDIERYKSLGRLIENWDGEGELNENIDDLRKEYSLIHQRLSEQLRSGNAEIILEIVRNYDLNEIQTELDARDSTSMEGLEETKLSKYSFNELGGAERLIIDNNKNLSERVQLGEKLIDEWEKANRTMFRDEYDVVYKMMRDENIPLDSLEQKIREVLFPNETEKVNSLNGDSQYYKYFYSPEQAKEAKDFQEETGWKQFWGSDAQNLNGDTIVVYRDIADLPEHLQEYAKEQERISLNAQADKIYREIITHVVDSTIALREDMRATEEAYSPAHDFTYTDGQAERAWEHERDRGHTWDIGENESHYDRDGMFLREYESNKAILSAIQFGLEKGISELDIGGILDRVYDGDIYANPEEAKELFEKAVNGVIKRDIYEYESYLKLYGVELDSPHDYVSTVAVESYSLYMYQGEFYLETSYTNGFTDVSWLDAENRKLIHVAQDFELDGEKIPAAIKEFGDNPNRENLIDVSNRPNERIMELISINESYRFNALKTELEAREIQKIDFAINERFRGYTNEELKEAVEYLKTYEQNADKKEIVIDGYDCTVIDEWQDGTAIYILGESIGDDGTFYYAQVTENDDSLKGVYTYEYDERPTRENVENEHLNNISQIALDRHEAEFGADGRRAFPHLNDEAEESEVEVMEQNYNITAADFSNLKLINKDTDEKTNSVICTFECEIKGEKDVLTYTFGQYDEDSRGWNFRAENNDLSNNMSAQERRILEQRLNEQVRVHDLTLETDLDKEEYKYYSIHRPVSIGTYPKGGMKSFENYNERTYVEAIGMEAWGEIIYDRPLTDKEISDYEFAQETVVEQQEVTYSENEAIVRLAERIDNFTYDNDYYDYADQVGIEIAERSEHRAQIANWIENGSQKDIDAIVKSISENCEEMVSQDEGLGNFSEEIREANDLIYSLNHLDEYQKFFGRETEANAEHPIREFHDEQDRVLEGSHIPIVKSKMRGFSDRSIVFYAVRDFEQENNLPENERVIHDGSYEDKEFLYGGYDRAVGLSHRNDLSIQPYMERLTEMGARAQYRNHSLLPLIAEVYFAQQNGLSPEQIEFILDKAKDDRYPVDLIKNLRHGFENGMSQDAIEVILGEDDMTQELLVGYMSGGGSIENAKALKGADVAGFYIIHPHLDDNTISREAAQAVIQTVEHIKEVNRAEYEQQRKDNPETAKPRFGTYDYEFFIEYLTESAVSDNKITAEVITAIGNSFVEQKETDNLRDFIEKQGGFEKFITHGEDTVKVEGRSEEMAQNEEKTVTEETKEKQQNNHDASEGISAPSDKKDAKELLKEQLQQGVRNVLNSESYKNWLDTSSKLFLNNYSFNNAILVWLQKEDATHTMGYEQWKDYGRAVAKGAKGIKIFVPVIAYEKKTGDLWRMIKSNLQNQFKNDPSLTLASYRIGLSKLEITMNPNGLYGLRMDGQEQGIRSEKDMQNLIKNSILGKVPMYFTVGTVFDAKDTIVPEYLWVKKGFTKDEMVRDENGNAIKNKKGEYQIVNTPERQARFTPTLEMKIPEKDPVKMAVLYEALKGVSERNGIHVYEKAREDDDTLKHGADGYFSRNFDAENPKGYIVMPKDLDPTKAVSVMLHEMGHSELHGNLEKLAKQMGEEKIPRHMREIQAESVAYVVGRNFGIETDMSSFKYLASYSQGFELQTLSKSIEVIYNECRQLTNELKAELEVRGLNMDLSDRAESLMDKESVETISKAYVTYAVEQDNRLMEIEKELPHIKEMYKENPQSVEIIVQQALNVERQKEDVALIKDTIAQLETADTYVKQKEQIDKIEAAKSRIEDYKRDFKDLSVQFQELAQEKQGLKDRFVAAPIATLKSMKQEYPRLAELSKTQIQYIGKSEYVEKTFSPMLRNEPEKFVEKVCERAEQIDKVASKNGMFVEVTFCEQWTDKPIVNDGAIMHPKVADDMVKQAEKQLGALRVKAESMGEYFPYSKCKLTIYQAKEGQISKAYTTRVDIGDGEQKSLIDFLKKECKSKDFVADFDKATREKGAKEKIMFDDNKQPQKENEKGKDAPLSDRSMSREDWEKEIITAKEELEVEQGGDGHQMGKSKENSSKEQKEL